MRHEGGMFRSRRCATEIRVVLVSCRVRENKKINAVQLILRRLSAHQHNNGQLVHLPLLGGYTACMDMGDVIVVSLSEWRIGRHDAAAGGGEK